MSPTTAPEAILGSARRQPRAEAVVDPFRRVTYGRLVAESRSVAQGLIDRGIQPGDRVGIWMSNRAEWIVAELAVSLAGGVLVPLNTRFGPDELGPVLAASSVRAVISDGTFHGRDYGRELRTLLPEAVDAPPGAWRSEEFRNLRDVVTLEDSGARGFATWSDVASTAPTSVDHRSRQLTGETLHAVLYTSGTLGEPKAVPLRYRNSMQHVLTMGDWLGYRPDDRLALGGYPMFVVGGAVNAYLSMLCRGGTLVLQQAFEPALFVECLQEESCSVIVGVEAMAKPLLDHADALRRQGTLRTGLIGPVFPATLRALVEEVGMAGLGNVWGMTEACGVVTAPPPGTDLDVRIGTFGRALPTVDLGIFDVATDEPCPPGVAGEIRLRGQAVPGFEGGGGWLPSGDQGRLTDDGFLVYVGRYKDVIKSNGFNVMPVEVERCIAALPEVDAVAVFGRPDQERVEAVVAAVVTEAPGALTEAQVVDHCRRHLAGFKVPRSVLFLSELPVTANGKVMKHELVRLADLAGTARAKRITH